MKLTDLSAQQVFDLMVKAIFRGEDPARQFYAYTEDDNGFTWPQLAAENRVPSLYQGLINDVERIYDGPTDCLVSSLKRYAHVHQLIYPAEENVPSTL